MAATSTVLPLYCGGEAPSIVKRVRFAGLCLLGMVSLASAPVCARPQTQACGGTGTPEEVVKSLLEKSRQEIKAFRDGGGKPEDANHPAIRWSELFWRCRETFRSTPAAADATAEAVHILIHAARARQAMELADSVPADDPAWAKVLDFVSEAAAETKDYRACVQRLERLLPNWQDSKLRARAKLALAHAHEQLEEKEQAAALFETVRREAAGTPFADHASNALRQLRELNPGQAAPAFEAKARDGSVVALAGFRNRAVVLIFWSTT